MPRGIRKTPENAAAEGHMFTAEPLDETAPENPELPPEAPRPISNTKGMNALTNYQPSADRNNIDQASQPTGTGSIAGGFDEGDLDETTVAWRPEPISGRLAKLASEIETPTPIEAPKKDEKLFPVRLLRNYRPATDRWYPLLSNGKLGNRPVSEEGLSLKVGAGYFIALPVSEARQIIKRGIAERADAID